jgi:hypothetical protein
MMRKLKERQLWKENEVFIYVENCVINISEQLHQISMFSLMHEELEIVLDTLSQSHPILNLEEWKDMASQALHMSVNVESHYWNIMTDQQIDRMRILDMAAAILVSWYVRELKRHASESRKISDST